MTRPALPATRDERIAYARATIAEAIALADATLTGEHPSPADSYTGCWCFTLQAGSFEIGIALNNRIAAALEAAGFGDDVTPSCTYGSPVGGPGDPHVGLYFHVPVGEELATERPGDIKIALPTFPRGDQ